MYMVFDLIKQSELILEKQNAEHKLDGASAFKFNPFIGLFAVEDGHGSVFDETPMYEDEEAGLLSIQDDDNDIAIDLKNQAGPNSIENSEESSGGYGDDMASIEY
jgi:hypothetical protein